MFQSLFKRNRYDIHIMIDMVHRALNHKVGLCILYDLVWMKKKLFPLFL